MSSEIDDGARPKARSERLVVHRIGEDVLIYDTECDVAHCLTGVESAVFLACDGSASIDDIANVVGDRVGEVISVDRVRESLAQLAKLELLELPAGLSRRRVIVNAGAATGAAVVGSGIVSMLVPTAAMALSGFQGFQGPQGFQGFQGPQGFQG